MIDNFEKLVARCETMRRRRMIRRSLLITGSFLLLISAVAGYDMWHESPTASEPLVKKTVPAPELNTTQYTPFSESNHTLPLPSVAQPLTQAASVSVPPLKTALPSVSKTAVAETHAVSPTQTPVLASPPQTERLFEVNTQISENPVEAYKTNPSYAAALAAARDFYAQENFADAAIWAKKANQLNREAEEAWLLYAKSYYAQGRKNEAIGILGLYLNYKDSKAASELLRTWKQTPAH